MDKLVNECRKDIEAAGIKLGIIHSVTVNTRAKSRWGQCCKNRYGTYDITISNQLLEDNVDDIAAKNTIIHELLHTIKGGSGHTGEWKKAAEIINSTYDCYTIKRCTSYEEKGIKREKNTKLPKYFIKCQNCGVVYRYYKKSKVVNMFLSDPKYARTWCKCGRCKSCKLELTTKYKESKYRVM